MKGKNGKKEHKVGCNCGGCKKRRGERIVHKPNCKCIACVNHRNKLAGVPRLYSNSHNSGKTRVYNLELNQGKLIDSEQVQEYLKNEWLLGSLKGKVI